MTTDLQHKRVVFGLTGGIACYKIADLIRRAKEHGAEIDVVMTAAAEQFITPVTLQALSGKPVYSNLWDPRPNDNMAHIQLSRQADAILIAPASTDFLAKLAHGFADDLLSTLCLARGACPLIVAPAMNKEMWAHPATQRNVQQLRDDGVHIWGPGHGDQACGEFGDGRMLESSDLLHELRAFFQPKVLQGKRVLITAGPTIEAIDPVRVISNRSSGKMGYAIAQAAADAGATVTLVSGPTALTTPYNVHRISVETAAQMHAAVMQRAEHSDAFIAVAAVADWHVSNSSATKIKKQADNRMPTISFAPNPDILADVAALPNAPFCVGFAAETNDLLEHASAKRLRKNVPLLVANLAQEAMNADNSSLVLIDEHGHTTWPSQTKTQSARALITHLAHQLTV